MEHTLSRVIKGKNINKFYKRTLFYSVLLRVTYTNKFYKRTLFDSVLLRVKYTNKFYKWTISYSEFISRIKILYVLQTDPILLWVIKGKIYLQVFINRRYFTHNESTCTFLSLELLLNILSQMIKCELKYFLWPVNVQ